MIHVLLATTLELLLSSSSVLEPGYEPFNVVEAGVQHGHVPFVLFARRRAGLVVRPGRVPDGVPVPAAVPGPARRSPDVVSAVVLRLCNKRRRRRKKKKTIIRESLSELGVIILYE